MSGRRVAILTHSTNPRGGVAHALALGEALVDLGWDATVHAPDASGAGFFRTARCALQPIPVAAASAGTLAMARQRVADYVAWFSVPANARFDLFHAQDGIGANALADLRARGRIGAFARTVHHIDRFEVPDLDAMQLRGVDAPDTLFCVSGLWRDALESDYGRTATLVGNGVDLERFSPEPDEGDALLLTRLRHNGAPLFVALGGVEERKNARTTLAALRIVRELVPDARLVIAGGASLLDHSTYRAGFEADLLASGLPDRAVTLTGPLPDVEMPALYRAADALVSPSLMEGFGLAPLEAMACGAPVIVSRIAPFTEHFSEGEVVFVDPGSAASVADGMIAALGPALRARLVRAGRATARRFGWAPCAERHLAAYRQLALVGQRFAHA